MSARAGTPITFEGRHEDWQWPRRSTLLSRARVTGLLLGFGLLAGGCTGWEIDIRRPASDQAKQKTVPEQPAEKGLDQAKQEPQAQGETEEQSEETAKAEAEAEADDKAVFLRVEFTDEHDQYFP